MLFVGQHFQSQRRSLLLVPFDRPHDFLLVACNSVSIVYHFDIYCFLVVVFTTRKPNPVLFKELT